MFCSKMNAASVVVTCEVVGTLNHYKMVKKKFELCALRGGGDIKTFRLSLAQVLALELELALELALEPPHHQSELALVLVLKLELELALEIELVLALDI